MADELRDLRAKISVESDAVLDAVSRVTGRDRSEIVRDVLHKWADEQIELAKVIHERLRSEGVTAAFGGVSGSASELRTASQGGGR